MIDARMNNKRSRQDPGAFNPYDKTCDDDFLVCCKGQCRTEAERQVRERAGGSSSAARDKRNTFCPGDFTGIEVTNLTRPKSFESLFGLSCG